MARRREESVTRNSSSQKGILRGAFTADEARRSSNPFAVLAPARYGSLRSRWHGQCAVAPLPKRPYFIACVLPPGGARASSNIFW
jgi:hypothetical protein